MCSSTTDCVINQLNSTSLLHDRRLCVIPILRPSRRVRNGKTIFPALLNDLSVSADNVGIDSKSVANRARFGYCVSFSRHHESGLNWYFVVGGVKVEEMPFVLVFPQLHKPHRVVFFPPPRTFVSLPVVLSSRHPKHGWSTTAVIYATGQSLLWYSLSFIQARLTWFVTIAALPSPRPLLFWAYITGRDPSGNTVRRVYRNRGDVVTATVRRREKHRNSIPRSNCSGIRVHMNGRDRQYAL